MEAEYLQDARAEPMMKREGREGGALSALDEQLDRLENAVSRLEKVVEPVTRGRVHILEEKDTADPETALHGKVARLTRQVGALERITNDIAL